jgi:hypothetical protein
MDGSSDIIHTLPGKAPHYLPTAGSHVFYKSHRVIHLPVSRSTAAAKASPSAGKSTPAAAETASAPQASTQAAAPSVSTAQRKSKGHDTEKHSEEHAAPQQHDRAADSRAVYQRTGQGTQRTPK